MMKRLVCAALCLLAVAPLAAPAAESLEQLRSGFQARLAGILITNEVESAKLILSYKADLENLSAKCKQENRNEDEIRVQRELARLRDEVTLVPSPPLGSMTEISDLQNSYYAQSTALIRNKCLLIVSLAEAHLAQLSELKASLTRSDLIDEALRVKREIDQIKAHPVIVGARLGVSQGGTEGVVVDIQPTGPALLLPCTECGGSGKAPAACTACRGSGRCITCAGTGKRKSVLTSDTKTCLSCKGTGACRACSGSGKLPSATPCRKCKGTGKTTAKGK